MATQAQLAAVQQLYVGYLGRAADSAGQEFWANAIANGTATIKSVATGFTLSAEYKAAYGGLSTDALVEKVYNNVLGRAPDAAGKAFWVASLANGKVTADTLVATIVTNLGALDQATINNKVFVAQTYTDTVGADYAPAGGAAVLVGVDSTPASVTAALAAISAGTLPGQVAGLALINTQTAAVAAELTYETANKTAVDALATKLDVAVVAGFDAELIAVSAKADANLAAIAGGKTLTVLTAEESDAITAQTAARTALSVSEKAKADAYVAAVKANAALKVGVPSDVAAAKAGLAADTGYAAALAKVTNVHATVTDIDKLYEFYTAASTTAAQRSAIDSEFAAQTKFATFKTTAATDITKNAAVLAESTAESAANAGFVSLTKAAADASKFVTDHKAAAADKASVDAIVTAHNAVEKSVADAGLAISAFNGSSTTTEIKVLANAVLPVAADAAVKETFYFAAKPNSSDFAIGTTAATQFAAGDAIVLGNGYTFNGGALTTGNSSALEFFLVKGATDTQIVIETAAYGNASTTLNAAGTAVTTSPDATVITLTGVTADHISIANGVISYV